MKNRSRTYKGGDDGTNTTSQESKKSGFFGGIFGKKENDGNDGESNFLNNIGTTATDALGIGKNDGEQINNAIKKAKTDYDNAVQEINKKLEEDRNKSKSQIVELEEKAQQATTKAKTDYDEKIKELKEKRNKALVEANQTAAALSQPMGGGKRARKSRRKVRKTKRNNKKARISRKKKHHKKSSRRHRK